MRVSSKADLFVISSNTIHNMKAVAVLLALVSVCRASGIGLSTVQVNSPLAYSSGIIGAPGLIGVNGLGLAGVGLAGPLGIASPLGLSAVQVNSAPIGLAAPGIITTNGLGLGLGAPGVIATNGLGLSAVQVNSGLARAAIAPIGISGLSTVQVNAAPAIGLSTVQVNAPIAKAAVVAAAPAGAVSVNANRGSVHVAPLPGHIVGSKQLNLSPAPGTW